jgi:hypothetical protein
MAQVPIGAPTWDYLAQWGPALPLLLILLWFADRWLKRLEVRAREIRDILIKIEVHHAERHEELMSELRNISSSVCEQDTKYRRRKPPPPDTNS